MYESMDALKPNLSQETLRRMKEVFGGQTCCRCGEPASRMAAEKFYCGLHFVRNSAKRFDEPKTYRCVIAS